MHTKTRTRWTMGLGFLAAATCWAVDDGEQPVTLEQLPAAARDAVVKLVGANKISELSREKEDGVEVFEAAWAVGAVEYEAAVTADGALLETEESVAATDAPAAVRGAVEKQFGAGTKVHLVKKTVVVYEAEGKVNGKEKEILIYPTGRMAEEDEDDDDNDDEDDDEDDDDEDEARAKPGNP